MFRPISFKDYLNSVIVKYPSLYACKDLNINKLRVLDQLLNVIGNGIRDNKELRQRVRSYKIVDESLAKQYMENDTYFGVIDRVNKNGESYHEFTDHVLESDKHLYPEVRKWIKDIKINKFEPYPNFQKRYSTIYQCPLFLSFPNDWLDAAKFFYKTCLKRFELDEEDYHDKPKPDHAKAFLDRFKEYKDNEAISKAYEFPYDGDIDKFLAGRWEKEKARIIAFIKETLELIERSYK